MSTIAATNLKNASSGSNNIVLNTDGSATVPTLSSTTITGTTIQGTIKSGTAVASTSGTSIDFTGIPSWVKRVTVILNGTSTNGTSNLLVQLGSTTFQTTSYIGGVASISTTTANTTNGGSNTGGFQMPGVTVTAASACYANLILTKPSSNNWIASGVGWIATQDRPFMLSGAVALSGTLDRVRITTASGTDTFDAGSINILYEG